MSRLLVDTEQAWPLGTDDPDQGQAVNAVGNPHVVLSGAEGFRPQNIIYSCLVTNYGLQNERLKIFPRSGTPKWDLERIPRMFVESLSINFGFSGGAIITPPGRSK